MLIFGFRFKELRKQWRESGPEEMTETADEQEAILREGVGIKLELIREELGQKATEEGKELGPDDNAVSLLATLQQHQEQEAEYLMRDLAVKVSQISHNSWLATTCQGGHVGRQNNKFFVRRICMIKQFSSQWRKTPCFCPPTWLPWRQLQTSNNVFLTFEFADEILPCDHSNKSF